VARYGIAKAHAAWLNPPHAKPGGGEGRMAELDKVAADNRQVYSGFLGITKWAIVLIALTLILMAIFLV
jgi:hypothetical protein